MRRKRKQGVTVYGLVGPHKAVTVRGRVETTRTVHGKTGHVYITKRRI